MCNNKCFKCFAAIAAIISALTGIVFVLLVCFGQLTPSVFGPVVAIAFGAFAIIITVIAATSLLRQDRRLNECICRKAKWVFIPALLLIALSAFAISFVLLFLADFVLILILLFFISALFVFLLFMLYCFLACLTEAGCDKCKE